MPHKKKISDEEKLSQLLSKPDPTPRERDAIRNLKKKLKKKEEERLIAESWKRERQAIRDDFSALVYKNPVEEYIKARCMTRHFILHIGPTNTGKTYQSLQRLKEARHGVYLSPLRLLALEVQERFLEEGVLCSMLTGEEEDIVPGAGLMSCTVEKVDISDEFDVAVVDECQMLRDPDRGWAWTRAILGLICPEIHVCMAPEAEKIVISMITSCGDTYEVHRHQRKTGLIVERKPFDFKNDVQKGDALVVFSRRQVIGLAAALENLGVKTSVIYGALPYRTRKEQVRRFANGETDVVVATDAIGMGMNLPIRRVVFMEVEKFDGRELRYLCEHEIKQIAGRAGRFGIYDQGYVASAEEPWVIEEELASSFKPLNRVQLTIPDRLIDLPYTLDKILSIWNNYPTDQRVFIRRNMNREIDLYERLLNMTAANHTTLTNREYYDCISIPFDEKNPHLMKFWLKLCREHFVEHHPIRFPELKSFSTSPLEMWEIYYKVLDLYYQFTKRFEIEMDPVKVMNTKAEVSDHILEELAKKPRRTCRRCHKPLPWNYRFNECQACYEAGQMAIAEMWRYDMENIRPGGGFSRKRRGGRHRP